MDPNTPYGSSYLFNGTLQAIIDNAPDEDTGQQWMREAFDAHRWDKPEDAKAALDRYSLGLSQQFQVPRYSEEDTLNLAPTPLDSVEGEGLDQIDKWEADNLQKLQTTEDSKYLTIRSKLSESIKDQASELRNKVNTNGQGEITSAGYRAALGMTGGIAKLVGGEDNPWNKYLEEHIPHSSADDDFGTKVLEGLESGVGTVVGALGVGAAATLAGAPAGAAALGYFVAGGIGEARGAYEQSLETTGDATRARNAGLIEAGAQAINIGVSEVPLLGKAVSRTFGKAATEEASKEVERTLGQAAARGIGIGATGAVASSTVSQAGRNYGQNTNLDPWADAPVQAAVGAVLGGSLESYSNFKAKSQVLNGKDAPVEDVPDPKRTSVVGGVVNGEATTKAQEAKLTAEPDPSTGKVSADQYFPADFITKDGSRYQQTADGKATSRLKDSSTEVFHPFDRTFYTDETTARQLAEAREVGHLYTDGEKLIVEQDGEKHVVPAELSPRGGLHPVEVNQPKNVNGNDVRYRSHIGQVITETPMQVQREGASLLRSGGAAAGGTREPTTARNIRTNPILSDMVKKAFGTENEGYFSYEQKSHETMTSEAEAFIGTDLASYQRAAEHIISLDPTHYSDTMVKAANLLIDRLDRAANEAVNTGNVEAGRQLADTAKGVGRSLSEGNVESGRAVAANVGTILSSTSRILSVENSLIDAAKEHVAKEEGVTPRELDNTDRDIQVLDAQIEEIDTKAKEQVNQAGSEFDPQIETIDQKLKAEEASAQKDVEEYQKARNEEADALEKQADEKDQKQNTQLDAQRQSIESAIEDRKQRIENTTKESKARADKLHADHEKNEAAINKLEEGGKAQAVKELDKQIKDSEEVLKKGVKGGVVSPGEESRAVARIKELKAKKEKPEPVLSKEEQKLLNSLKRNREKLAKQVVETPREGVLSESERKQIENWQKEIETGKKKLAEHKEKSGSSEPNPLRERAKKLRDEAKNATAERITNKDDRGRPKRIIDLKNEKEKLTQKKEAAKKERTKNGSHLTEEQQAQTDALKEKKAKLTARKNKFEAEKEKRLAAFTPEMREEIRKSIEAAKKMGGIFQHGIMREVGKIEQKLLKDNPNAFDWFNLWRANQLTNLATHMTSAVSGAFAIPHNAAALMVADLMRGRLNAQHFLKGALGRGLKKGIAAGISELKGTSTHRSVLSEGSMSESFKNSGGTLNEWQMRNSWKEGGFARDFVDTMPAWAKRIGLHNMQHTFRLLSAVDAMASAMVGEGYHEYVAKTAEKNLGFKDEATRKYVADVKSKGETQVFTDAHQKATEEAELLHDLTGKRPSKAEINYRAYEIADEQRPEALRMQVKALTSRDVLIEGPKDGALGWVSEHVKALANTPIKFGDKEFRPVRYIALPFVNISLSFLRSNLDVVPILGAGRLLDKNIGELARHNLIGKQLMGIAATTALSSIAYGFKDEKKPLFAINGAGSGDTNLRKTMQNAGHKPYTLQFGDHYWSYADTPFALLLGAIGSYMDRVRFDPKYDQKIGAETLGTVLAGGADTFMNQSFLQSLGMIYEAARRGDEKGFGMLADLGVVRPIKGFIPASAALRMVTKITNNDIDTKANFYSKVVSGIPVVQGIGTIPSLNAFGEELPNNPEARYTFISKFHSERVTDPDWRWLAENRYKVTFPNITSIELPKTKGTEHGQARIDKLGAQFENVLTPQEAHDLVRAAGPEVRELVASYRAEYGESGRDEKVQERLTNDISKIYSRKKAELFSEY